MKKLLGINDKADINYHKFEVRLAARAVAVRHDGEIPLLHVGEGDYYKLGGGGIEQGENIETALRREMLEETGCSIEILRDIGYVIEFRTEWKLIQISFAFLAKVVREVSEPKFTEKEIKEGFRLRWVKLEAAAAKLLNEGISNYQAGFIVKRDSAILEEALRIIKTDYHGRLF